MLTPNVVARSNVCSVVKIPRISDTISFPLDDDDLTAFPRRNTRANATYMRKTKTKLGGGAACAGSRTKPRRMVDDRTGLQLCGT